MARNEESKSRGGNDKDKGESSEFIERLVNINRVAKVVKGGRRFSFAALVVIGDGRGTVGFGTGKAREVPEAVAKATYQAQLNMVHVPLREGRTLHHDVVGNHGSGIMLMRAAPSGTGVIAGGAARAIFEVLGISDVVAKSIGSNNPHNMVRATFDGLTKCRSPRHIANKRGLRVSDILSRRRHMRQSVDKKELSTSEQNVGQSAQEN